MKPTTTMSFKNGIFAAFLVVFAGLAVSAPSAAPAEPASQKNPGYTVLKGGYYYPSEVISFDQFSGVDFNRKKGYTGEIAFGHHYGSIFGVEFGVGYLEDKRYPSTGSGNTKLEALPVLLSAKLFLPIGPLEPYGEVGYGAYFTRFEVEPGAGGNRIFRDTAFGPHAGFGVNVNLSDSFYLGLEGRYRWLEPTYGGQKTKLDGYTATINVGFRY